MHNYQVNKRKQNYKNNLPKERKEKNTEQLVQIKSRWQNGRIKPNHINNYIKYK